MKDPYFLKFKADLLRLADFIDDHTSAALENGAGGRELPEALQIFDGQTVTVNYYAYTQADLKDPKVINTSIPILSDAQIMHIIKQLRDQGRAIMITGSSDDTCSVLFTITPPASTDLPVPGLEESRDDIKGDVRKIVKL